MSDLKWSNELFLLAGSVRMADWYGADTESPSYRNWYRSLEVRLKKSYLSWMRSETSPWYEIFPTTDEDFCRVMRSFLPYYFLCSIQRGSSSSRLCYWLPLQILLLPSLPQQNLSLSSQIRKYKGSTTESLLSTADRIITDLVLSQTTACTMLGIYSLSVHLGATIDSDSSIDFCDTYLMECTP